MWYASEAIRIQISSYSSVHESKTTLVEHTAIIVIVLTQQRIW